MATKKRGAKKASGKSKKIEPGDSPVTVGGGAGVLPYVELEFDHNDYLADPNDTDNWVSEDLHLYFVEILDARDTVINTYPAVNQVVVRYRGGGASKITFKEKPTGVRPLGVRFKGTDLPYQGGKHRRDGLSLWDVKIDSGNRIPLELDWKVRVHTQ